MSAILELDAVSKRFGGLLAVDNVAFAVERGEIFGIIGPNGAGKTTLFNLITGFATPDAGDIRFGGREITGLPPHVVAQRGLVRSFQSSQMFSDMPVLDALVAAALLRRPLRDAIRRAEEVLDSLGLHPKRNMSPAELSYPDKRLLELGKCLATDPQLILLDEVMAGLTQVEAEVPLSIIRRLREDGLTFILVEHIMPIVMKTADRIAVINFGKKIAEGKPETIVHDPAVQKSYLGEAVELA